MKTIYLISGLGADERAFQDLDLSGYTVTPVKWIPAQPNETIESYANRLKEQITTPNPILIGLSFGGMIAMELAKLIDVEKIILISSVKTKRELPFYFRLAGDLRLNSLIPKWFLKHPTAFIYWLSGIKDNKERRLLNSFMAGNDVAFIRWSIAKIVNWKNTATSNTVHHLHGTSDRIFPIQFITCNFKIKGGGHFMVMNKAEELSVLIRRLL